MMSTVNRTPFAYLRTLLFLTIGFGLLLVLGPGVEASPAPLSPVGADARHPDVVVSADGVIHVVWEQDGGIWHRMQKNGVWSDVAQIVANGEDPVLAAAPTGEIVYLAWSQSFGGNFEVFTSRWNGSSWSPGQNVSSNDGGSATPTLAVAANGDVHLLWSDTSPGSSTIYHAVSPDGLAWPSATPIPGANGTNPTAAFASDGTLYVAWQYRAGFTEKNRIWTSSFNGSWQTPAPLTDGAQHALAPELAANASQTALTWQEGTQVRLALWQGGAWQTQRSENGQAPALSLTNHGFLYWAWAENNGLQARFRYAAWSPVTRWGENPQGSGDLSLTAHNGQVYKVWAEHTDQGWQVYIDATRLGNLYMPVMLN